MTRTLFFDADGQRCSPLRLLRSVYRVIRKKKAARRRKCQLLQPRRENLGCTSFSTTTRAEWGRIIHQTLHPWSGLALKKFFATVFFEWIWGFTTSIRGWRRTGPSYPDRDQAEPFTGRNLLSVVFDELLAEEVDKIGVEDRALWKHVWKAENAIIPHLHCELQLIHYLERNDIAIHKNVIGVSKLTCFACNAYVGAVNTRRGLAGFGPWMLAGTSDKFDPAWLIPQSTDGIQAVNLIWKRLKKGIQNLTRRELRRERVHGYGSNRSGRRPNDNDIARCIFAIIHKPSFFLDSGANVKGDTRDRPHGANRGVVWVMWESTVPMSVLKRKRDHGISEDERDSESMSDNGVAHPPNDGLPPVEGHYPMGDSSYLSATPFDAAVVAFILSTETLPREAESCLAIVSRALNLESTAHVCNRTQFTTLQGLLNHARLAHGIEWASHDACITACATPISADDQNWEAYEQDGVEVIWGGNVVGLRRLFERAVGVDINLPTPPSAHLGAEASPQSSTPTQSTLLSRTLGSMLILLPLHNFSGRAPKRRCIHVYDEERPYKMMKSSLKKEPQARTDFRMRYPHRNTAREDLDLMVDVKTEGATEGVNIISNAGAVPTNSTASRFHITARVHLEDRSLYLSDITPASVVPLPRHSRPAKDNLTCVAECPTTAFCVIGMRVDEPWFLLKGRIWNGVGTQRESTSAEPCSVDRSFPAHQIASQPDSSGNCGITTVREEPYEQVLRSLLPRVPMTAKGKLVLVDPISTLTTISDMKPRTNVRVPYKLVASLAHLLAFVPGRRKAIEVGDPLHIYKFSTVRTEYILKVGSCSRASRTLCRANIRLVTVTTNIIDRCVAIPSPISLHDGNRRTKEKGEGKGLDTDAGEEICPICGIKKRLHPGYGVKMEVAVIRWSCTIVPSSEQQRGTRLPLTNLLSVLSWHDGLERAIHGPQLPPHFTTGSSSTSGFNHPNMFSSTFRFTPRDLVTLSSPELVLAVQNCIDRLCLPRFLNLPSHGSNPAFLESREQTERSLAPAALLSATLKPFISTLLRSAVEVAKHDRDRARTKSGRGKRAKKIEFVLTPGHVLRGQELASASAPKGGSATAQGGGNGVADTGYFRPVNSTEAIALCLRVGMPLSFGRILAADPDAHAADHE
ncbi:hypothetical protein BU15DRAFT_65922 [Melanogaster broomeanus]|nr:hypothetical protein BU15DRAFT_65922 [Melanogaster broomeanus]